MNYTVKIKAGDHSFAASFGTVVSIANSQKLAYEDRLVLLEQEKVSLENEKAGLEENIASLKADVADEREKNEGLQKNIASLENEKALLEKDLEAIEAEITSLNEEIEKLEEQKLEEYEKGKADGAKSEYDSFWDSYQMNGEREAYHYAFAGMGWNDETFKPKYDIVCKDSSSYAFSYFQGTDLAKLLEDCGVTLNTREAKTMQNFYANSAITRAPVTDVSLVPQQISSLFYRSYDLKKVDKLIVGENSVIVSSFNNCSSLTDIIFEGVLANNGINMQWCPLSLESITSLVNVLSETTNGLSITLSASAVNKAFETADGLSDGVSSEKWLSLVATKSNWTISLV